MIRHQVESFRWEGVDLLPYKEDGTIFKSVTRQTLFHGGHDLPVEFRYFEVGEGGHSTLERHCHAHVVMVVRGSGQVLVGDEISDIGVHDLVQVAPMTWHQFRANRGEELGFLCLVSADRDRPQRPDPADLDQLRSHPTVADFIRV
jgi:mannose-6-phosphate isomerase-like protein (cupin superfamily)